VRKHGQRDERHRQGLERREGQHHRRAGEERQK
jgi:hypothetical protein